MGGRIDKYNCWYVLQCLTLSSVRNNRQKHPWLQTQCKNSMETCIFLRTRSACVFVLWLNTQQTYCDFKIIIKQNWSSTLLKSSAGMQIFLLIAFASETGWESRQSCRYSDSGAIPQTDLPFTPPPPPQTSESSLYYCKSFTQWDNYQLDKVH